MKNEKLLNAIGQINDDYITDAKPREKKSSRAFWIKFGAIAACFAFTLGIGISMLMQDNENIKLSLSSENIRVEYIEEVSTISTQTDLEWLTEEEIFTKYETTIFSGTINEIRNIQIDYNGGFRDYRAIAKITIEDIYRGDLSSGDIVTVLLPCPVNMQGVWVEDTETVSAMREGMRGIFMPIQYDEESYRTENGATLFLQDIADYGFLDGWRYTFLQTDEGLVFAREAFSSIDTATTLGEVENYIIDMIK